MGATEVFINLHHKGDMIRNALSQLPKELATLQIHFSDESDQILGTGGALKKLEPFLNLEKDFIVMNSDTFLDEPLTRAILQRRDRNATALMVLKKRNLSGDPNHQDPRDSRQLFYDRETLMYTGTHILTPHVFQFLPPGPSDIIEAYYNPLIKQKMLIDSYVSNGAWFDIGTVSSLFHSSMRLLKRLMEPDYEEAPRFAVKSIGRFAEEVDSVWIGPQAQINSQCTLIPPVILGAHSILEPNCVVGPFTIIGDHVRVPARAHLQETIVLPESKILPKHYSRSVLWNDQKFDVDV